MANEAGREGKESHRVISAEQTPVDLAAFIAAIGSRSRFTSTHRDPLIAAWCYLDANGEAAEAQALRRVIRALAATDGDFAEADLWLFSTDTLTLIDALVETRIQGRYPDVDWLAL